MPSAMSHALRYGASASFFVATALLGASMFLPVEKLLYHEDEGGTITDNLDGDPSVAANAWLMQGSLPTPGPGNFTPDGATWYDDAFSDADGIWLMRLAGPLVLLGTLVVLVCGFLILSSRGTATGWTGTAGLLVGGLGMLLLLLGINAVAKSVTLPNTILDNNIKPDWGFWTMFLGLLVGSGGALASFSVRPQPKGRIGPDGQPLPPLPVLSVENPDAFNPMANREPRPFRKEENPYQEFQYTGGPRKFKPGESKDDAGEEPPEGPPAAAPAPKSQPGASPKAAPKDPKAQASKAPPSKAPGKPPPQAP